MINLDNYDFMFRIGSSDPIRCQDYTICHFNKLLNLRLYVTDPVELRRNLWSGICLSGDVISIDRAFLQFHNASVWEFLGVKTSFYAFDSLDCYFSDLVELNLTYSSMNRILAR